MERTLSPTSPGSSRPGHTRERSRGISFRSDRSGDSKSRSEPLVESPRERDRKSMLWNGSTKANPNAALEENQPGERSFQEASTMQNLRDMEHKDQNGQTIAEPDLSNPTRPRFERPLDTIRSFEKAIDNGYKRRSSYVKQESSEQYDQNNQYASRRSSYFGGLDAPNNQQQQYAGGNGNNNGGAGYYGPPHGAPQQGRPDSAYMNGRSRLNRMQSASDPYVQQQQLPPQQQQQHQQQQQQGRPYPQHTHHQSHDTVNTGGTYNSDSTGHWANSTDPSSENSSIDRNMMPPQAMNNKPQTPAGMENGGYYGGPTGPIMEEQAYGDNGYGGGYGNSYHQNQQQYQSQQQQQQQQQQYYGGGGGGRPQPGAAYGNPNGGPVRRPIPLGNSGGDHGIPSSTTLPNMTRGGPESEAGKDKKANRKSWLKRRFSRD